MKTLFKFSITILFLVSLSACGFGGVSIDFGGNGGADTKEEMEDGGFAAIVQAGIDSPPNGATLNMAPVSIAYYGSHVKGVSAVELSINGEVVNSFNNPDPNQMFIALSHNWQPTAPGMHTIRVRARSAGGMWGDYATTSVNIEGDASGQPDAAVDASAIKTQAVQTAEAQAEMTVQAAMDLMEQGIDDAIDEVPPAQETLTPGEFGFTDIRYDFDKFYYGGSGCGSKKVTISTRVTQPEKVYGIYLFTRFFDLQGGGTTKWDSSRSMKKMSDGTYQVTLVSDQIRNYNTYWSANMNFQMVVQDKPNSVFAKSEVFKIITLERCP